MRGSAGHGVKCASYSCLVGDCQLYGGVSDSELLGVSGGSEVMSAQRRSEIVSRRLAFSLHYKSQQLRRLSCILSNGTNHMLIYRVRQ